MKELKSPDKIVQKMTRDGAVEVNKSTGGAEHISAQDAPDVSPGDSGADIIGGVADRVLMERRAHKKKAARKANRKIYKQIQRKPETSRLTFSDAERGDPSLAKSIKKSDRAADRYEKARARIPKEKVLSIERVTGKPDGKPATRLVFRERDKPPNGKLTHILDRPGREAAHAVRSEFSQSDNVGAQAAGFSGKTAGSAARRVESVHSRLKFEPQRKAAKAGEKAVNANVNALYKRDLRLKPELENANMFKKAAYKRKLKKDYSRAFRTGNFEKVKKNAKKAKNAAKKTGDAAKEAIKFTAKHWKVLAMAGAGLLLLMLLMSGISSCASMFGGGFNTIIATSYTAEDTDIIGADIDYTALENGLRQRIANTEADYPGYNEYRFFLDEIGHDPFELTSYLTARYNAYTRAAVQGDLSALFSQQYTLILTPVTEVRYRTETRTDSYTYTDPETGESYTEEYTYTVQVPYNYYILNVSLVNRSLGSVALANLTAEQAEMYDVYMETKGNKPELFADNVYVNRGEYTDYDIPPDALTDVKFAAMIREAEKYLGYPYVWGGSSPSTSFDCSGFVSWVINQSGVGSVGRMTASGLMNHCAIIPPSEAKPGDLIFFQGTYDTPGASHVGIYVGDGMMIHCGNPISYASVTTSYWTNHFYAYGRLP